MEILRKIEKILSEDVRFPMKCFVLEVLIKINFLNKKKSYLYTLERLLGSARAIEIFDSFYSVNSPYWKKEYHSGSSVVLVEGFLAEYGPNYLIRTGIITKAIEKEAHVRPVVLLSHGVTEELQKKKLYSSFNINECLGIYNDIYASFSLLKKFYIAALARVYFYYAEILFLFNKGECFIQLSFRGIQIGDMLYDELIKECQQQEYTIRRVAGKHYQFFKKTFVYFFALEHISRTLDVKYYVSTHSQYISYGLPLRYFYHKNVSCFETTDDQLFIYDFRTNIVPRYHVYMHEMVANRLTEILRNENLLSQTKKELEDRFSGKMEQIDVQLAYSGKRVYTKQDLKSRLGIQNNNPIVFIFAHIFSDTPRGSSRSLLFMDFYQWLYETVRYISQVRDVNWIIKPHPAVKVYNEHGKVDDIVERFKGQNNSIYLCPSDFSTAGVRGSADVIVTCQGTAGLEYSCVGIPVILAGEPFYADFGFTHQPRTQKEYFNLLKDVRRIKSLDAQQIKVACAVYLAFKSCFNTDYALIDTVLKNKVWGVQEEPDALGAFQLMTDRLARHDPKTQILYGTVVDHFQQMKI